MKKHQFLLLLMAGIFFTACNSTLPTLSDSQKLEIEKQVLAQWNKVVLTVQKADADSFMTAFSTENFIAMYSGVKPFITREEYSDSVKAWFIPRLSSELQEAVVKVKVLTEDLVILDQTSMFLVNLKNNQVTRCNHIVSFIFKKEASGWMIIHGNESWTNI